MRIFTRLFLLLLVIVPVSKAQGILFGVPINFNLQGDDSSKVFRFNLGNIIETNQSGFTIVDKTASPVSAHATSCLMPGAYISIAASNPQPKAPSLPPNAANGSWNVWQVNGVDTWVYNYNLVYAAKATISGNMITITFSSSIPSTMFSGDYSNPVAPSVCPLTLTVLYNGV
jgi:hypothetical protein